MIIPPVDDYTRVSNARTTAAPWSDPVDLVPKGEPEMNHLLTIGVAIAKSSEESGFRDTV